MQGGNIGCNGFLKGILVQLITKKISVSNGSMHGQYKSRSNACICQIALVGRCDIQLRVYVQYVTGHYPNDGETNGQDRAA